MHDLLWFCSRPNFLNRPTLIFTKLLTSFLKNRTIFGGSFSHVLPKNLLTFPCNEPNPCMSPSCLPLHPNRSKRKETGFFHWLPLSLFTTKIDAKKYISLEKHFRLCLLNVSFKITTRRVAWRCRKKSEGTPSSGWKSGGEAHLVIEGILVEHQRLRDCLCTGPDEGGVTEKTSLFPATRGPLMKFICFKWNARLKNFCDSDAMQECNFVFYCCVALSI